MLKEMKRKKEESINIMNKYEKDVEKKNEEKYYEDGRNESD
jgi:hypothetical protein